MADLNISFKLYTGASTFLELNNKTNYRLSDGSFDNQAVQHRRKTATNPFVEGEYVVSSLRGNVTEQVNVQVFGATQFAARSAVQALQTALEQTTFQVVRTIDNWKTTWTCYASDYTMQSNRPLMNAKMVIVQIQLLRDPVETYASV
jgi:hypothetical protein